MQWDKHLARVEEVTQGLATDVELAHILMGAGGPRQPAFGQHVGFVKVKRGAGPHLARPELGYCKSTHRFCIAHQQQDLHAASGHSTGKRSSGSIPHGLIASHPGGPYKPALDHVLGVLVIPTGKQVSGAGREAVPARTALSGSDFAEVGADSLQLLLSCPGILVGHTSQYERSV